MSHSAVLFDYEFDIAHTLKKVSYVCVLTGLLVSMYGIFKREQESTERIRESEELFSKAFHSSPALMTISEPETGKHFDVNEMWMDTLGYSREEAAHNSAIELGVWAKPEERENFIKKLLEDQSVKNLETTFRKKNGSEIEVLIAGEIVQIGQENRLLFVAHDISKQKEMDRMKGEFVSTVSHELRTPLTSIKGSLGLIKSGTVGEMPPQMESMLDIAYKNSDRLVLLINDILDMEKIEAGQMDYRMRRLDLVSTVRHAIQADSGFGEEYGVEIAISEVPANAYVEGDEIRLAQVLSNLISNAAKFSPVGGRVEVGIDKIGESYRVLVNDNGSGIPDDFKDKIFDKFSQSDSSDTRKSGGTGLGLSIAKAIIERHRGSIDYTSEVGKGTTFFFSLPEFDETEIELLRKPDVLRREYRILICEDEPDVAKLLDVILRQSGFKTAIAYDAAQAKAQLATENFDAMTLDIALPDQNGISLIQELRSDPDTQYLPILVISAKASDSEKELNGEAFGIIDWLQKPIDEDVLISRLRNALAISSDRKPLVLHVEDDGDICSIVSKLLDEMAEVVVAKDITSAKRHLKDNNFDLMLLDMVLPDGSGEELLSLLQRSDGTKTPVIIFSVKDVSQDMADGIQAALVKSQTTNELLLETIVKAIETDWAANLKRTKN